MALISSETHTYTQKECMVACQLFSTITFTYKRSCVEFMIVDDIVD